MSIISSLASIITKGRKIRFKQGLEANLPSDLDIGEPAFTTDEKNVYIGSDSGNVKMLTEADAFSVDDIPLATTTKDGLMPKDDKLKLNGISAGANHTTVIDNLTSTSITSAASANQVRVLKGLIDNLPVGGGSVALSPATSTTLGGIKVGNYLSVETDGKLNINEASTSVIGVTKLNDTATSTSTTEASTARVAKSIYDLAKENESNVSELESDVNSHKSKSVVSEEGVHDFRYYNNELSILQNNQWVEIDTGGTSIPNVINFTGSSSADGKQINLSWINPVSTEYLRTELYMSSTDISNLDLEQTQLVSQKVVNDNTSTSYVKTTQHGEQVFFKVYTVFTFLGSETHSKSNTLNIIATDSIPPSKVTNVQIKPSDGKLTVSWTNPSDLDFSSVRLNYSLNDDINTIDDGILLHNGSGNTVELDGLVNSIPVYLRFFTVDSNGNINDDVSMKYTGTPILGDDIWTGIGSINLIAGDMQAGYFGRVPASELFTGSQLAQLVGITAGVAQHDTTDWLKFAYQGKILFRPMKAIRHTISWDNINAVGCVLGTKTVSKNGLTFKVRLMKGSTADPAIIADSATNTMKGSEWNKLMLPIHEQAATKAWAYPNYVESDVQNWGIGFTDADLMTHSTYGNGVEVMCQEAYYGSPEYHTCRGGLGASYSYIVHTTSAVPSYGWCPVLELVQGGA